MPYRTGAHTAGLDAPRDAGIVGDIIGQFADRFAFFRELVQNSIDAGSPEIDVELDHRQGAGVMRVAVTDRGEGMGRQVIENRLLVLFRSTKEKEEGKIGKFGIGFASVLAMRPQLIRVTSVRDGRRLVLELYPDLSYELFDAGSGTRTGTTVELEIPVAESEAESFRDQSISALVKWCRHATVPIRVRTVGRSARLRIDRPLALDDALVEISSATSEMRVVVGLRSQAKPYAGFFNHGLTLYESESPLVGGLAFKVQDSRLGHTLSRDDVRRDRHFDRALERVRNLAEKALPAAIVTELQAAIDGNDLGRYAVLLTALTRSKLWVSLDHLPVPVVHPSDGKSWVSAREWMIRNPRRLRGPWIEQSARPATSFLAERGVHTAVCPYGQDGAQLREALETLVGRPCRWVGSQVTVATRVEPTTEQAHMLDCLRLALDVAYRPPRGIVLARLDGLNAAHVSIAGPTDVSARWLVDEDDVEHNPFAFLRRATLVLNVSAPLVAAALARALSEPMLAASLLVRGILLQRDKLGPNRSQKLLESELEELVG